jgi:hypothetical protein
MGKPLAFVNASMAMQALSWGGNEGGHEQERRAMFLLEEF